MLNEGVNTFLVIFYPFLTGEADDSDSEDEAGKISDDESDGQDSDASGPSYMEDLAGGCSFTRQDSATMKNDPCAKGHKHCIEDQVLRDVGKEGFVLGHKKRTEKLQQENTDVLQLKHPNFKKRICDATFVIDRCEGSSSVSHQGLSGIYKKPVSIVQPITSSGVKLSCKTSLPKQDHPTNIETSDESDYELDLAQAIMCSRNKIALALAGIVESEESTGHTDGESEPMSQSDGETSQSDGETSQSDRETSQSGGESCVPCPSSEESCYRSQETGIEKKTKGDRQCREQIKATMIMRPNKALDNNRSKVLDSEKHQLMCSSEDGQRPFVRRQSLKIVHAPMDHKTNSSPHSVKLENWNIDQLRVTSSPVKRRSATLCKLGGSLKSDGQGSNLEGCLVDSLIMSPGSKALGTPSGHQTTPLVQCPISPAQLLRSSNSNRRRSSQILRVNKDTAAIDSWCSVWETKGAGLEHHRESCSTFLKKAYNCQETNFPTVELTSSISSLDVVAGENSSKRSLFFSRSEDLHSMSRENRVRGSPHPVSSHQNSNPLLVYGEALCKEKQESSSSVTMNRRDRRLSCSKTNGDLIIRNSGAKSCPSPVTSWKNSSELNCKWKLLEISSPLCIRAKKERLSADRAENGFESNERAVKSLQNCVSSPSSRNSMALSGGIGNKNSPSGSNVRKRRARESVAMDTPDSLPTKQAKRDSPLSSYLEQGPKNTPSSQALSRWGRESTPMKERHAKSARLEGFPRQNTKTLSPIRRTVADTCAFVQDAFVSPCGRRGSCDKSFCLDCC